MNFLKKYKSLTSFIVLLFLSISLLFPEGAQAQTAPTTSQAASATSDCAASALINLKLQTAMAKAYSSIFGSSGLVNAAVAVPTSDATIAATTASAAGDANAGTNWSVYGKPTLDCIAYKMGQLMLDNFTNDTISWINGGFNGSPHYAIDPAQMEKDLANSVAGNLLRYVEGAQMCDFGTVFINDLKQWIVLGQADPAPLYQAQVACPFVGINASDFYRGLQAFSWQYFEKALNDRGNPFGVAVITSNELTQQQAMQQAAAQQQLSWNSGFLSVVDSTDLTKCNWPDTYTADAVQGVNQQVPVTQSDGTIKTVTLDPLTDAQKTILERQYCPKVTPGKLIEAQLTKATGVAFDRLGLADNLSKIIDALVTKVSQCALDGVFKGNTNSCH